MSKLSQVPATRTTIVFSEEFKKFIDKTGTLALDALLLINQGYGKYKDIEKIIGGSTYLNSKLNEMIELGVIKKLAHGIYHITSKGDAAVSILLLLNNLLQRHEEIRMIDEEIISIEQYRNSGYGDDKVISDLDEKQEGLAEKKRTLVYKDKIVIEGLSELIDNEFLLDKDKIASITPVIDEIKFNGKEKFPENVYLNETLTISFKIRNPSRNKVIIRGIDESVPNSPGKVLIDTDKTVPKGEVDEKRFYSFNNFELQHGKPEQFNLSIKFVERTRNAKFHPSLVGEILNINGTILTIPFSINLCDESIFIK
ncbi:MAG: hypothetical protein ACFFD4_40730, partial [Candidatus Odinarchaeota archaeon]